MEKKARIIKVLTSAFFVFAFLAITPHFAHAANLYFSPSSGSHAVGGAFSVSVYVSSANQAMNAASGVISFPPDKLEVASLSKTGSIFSLWVQEPLFYNGAGTINFEGIVLNPGFIGSAGKIITINFRAKSGGSASLNFSSGSVLANDGKGTNILTGLGDAAFSLGGAVPITVPEATTPGALALSSPTHPDPNKWYADNNPKFVWPLPQDAEAVRLLVGKLPQVTPTIDYVPPVASKELSNLEDGVWYFHARLRNSAGWGEISRFRFQIDIEKPDRFDIREVTRSDLTEPKAKFVFDASDETSGIDHYEIQIDSESSQVWRDDGGHIYETETLSPGKHTLIAKAVDKAGNVLANSAEFIIEALEAPMITDWPKELPSGEQLIVKGTSKYPDSQIVVWLQREGKDAESQTAKSDGKGSFVFTAEERPKDGIYKLWAEVVDERGARSLPSEKVTIAVKRPAFLIIGSWAVSLLAVVVSLVALAVLLLFAAWYGWHKFSMFIKRLKKEVREAELALHTAFDLLKEDIREQVKMLEKTKTKRELTEEEEKVIKQLKKDLDDAEKFVRKEIEDIKKEIK